MQLSVRYLPIINLLLLSLTLCTTLILTLINKKDKIIFPYISDIGTLPPASCIFGQSLNLLWILFSFATYIKYRQTRHLFIKHSLQRYTILNRTALCVGLLASFGCSIAANFQETSWIYIHWIGTILVLGFGAAYQCLQTLLYRKLLRLTLVLEQKRKTKLRVVISAVSVTTFCIFFISAIYSNKQKEGEDYLHWESKDRGYSLHKISVVAEWICGASTITYFTLFYGEFAEITIHEPDVFVEEECINTDNLERYTETVDNT